MINLGKLQNALVEYRKIFKKRWKSEKYKWEAVKWFQDNWDINANDFADMFAKATEKTANLLASMNNFPRKMMIQYAQDDAETVRATFMMNPKMWKSVYCSSNLRHRTCVTDYLRGISIISVLWRLQCICA